MRTYKRKATALCYTPAPGERTEELDPPLAGFVNFLPILLRLEWLV